MIRIGLALIAAAIALCIMGAKESKLAGQVKDEAQAMTCQQLAAQGPGDNAHVLLSGCVLCTWDYVYATEHGMPTEAFVPAVPEGSKSALDAAAALKLAKSGPRAGNQPAAPKMLGGDVKVIILTHHASEGEVRALAGQQTIEGLVVNSVAKLETKAADMLRSAYPSADISRCWIVDVDRKAASSDKVGLFWIGGILSAVAGVFVLVKCRSN